MISSDLSANSANIYDIMKLKTFVVFHRNAKGKTVKIFHAGSMPTPAQVCEFFNIDFNAVQTESDEWFGISQVDMDVIPIITDAPLDGVPFCKACGSWHAVPKDRKHHAALKCRAPWKGQE